MPLAHRLPAIAAAAAAAVGILLHRIRSRSLSMDPRSTLASPSTLLVLAAKSPRESDLAVALKSNAATIVLSSCDGDETGKPCDLAVLLDSETDLCAFSSATYMSALTANSFGRLLIWSPRLSSTHDLVSKNFHLLPIGTVCIADVQFKGRGRVKNVWESPPGCLMFSFTLQTEDGRTLPLLQYVVSLATTEAVKESCRARGLPEIDVRIKWPNDIYLDGLKVGGVLCTSTYRLKYFNVCAGVGLNVDNKEPTTCLNAALENLNGTDTPWLEKEDILARFFNKFDKFFDAFVSQGFGALEEMYYKTWLHNGQRVIVEDRAGDAPTDAPVTVQGLTPTGYLLALGDDGARYELHPDGNSFDFFKGLVRRKIG